MNDITGSEVRVSTQFYNDKLKTRGVQRCRSFSLIWLPILHFAACLSTFKSPKDRIFASCAFGHRAGWFLVHIH